MNGQELILAIFMIPSMEVEIPGSIDRAGYQLVGDALAWQDLLLAVFAMHHNTPLTVPLVLIVDLRKRHESPPLCTAL